MDADLVVQAARGDREAFAALARLSSDRLFAIAYRIVRDHHLAEDALQHTLITIWDQLPRLRDPGRFEAWSYRLIVRDSISAGRRQRRGQALVLIASDADPQAPDSVGRVADREELERALGRLTPEHRAVVTLQYFVGLSLAEIAEVLGIPLGTAGSRLHYALRQLRAELAAEARPSSTRNRTGSERSA